MQMVVWTSLSYWWWVCPSSALSLRTVFCLNFSLGNTKF